MHTQIPDIHNLMNMFSKVVEQHGLIMALKCDKALVYTFSTNLTSHFNLKQDLQRNHLHILDTHGCTKPNRLLLCTICREGRLHVCSEREH